mmetsp:Transcript_28313/g.63842  ORF Transcript_28313/g.63842 Transcript_28313/m.63842 type:complete len:112 (-) Transcript_28313:15-350(-)
MPREKICSSATMKRRKCHMQHGIQDESCVQEELLEKKCFAETLCVKEAIEFYHQPMRKDADVKASCNTLVESFAFPEQMLPDVIQKSDRDYCRKVVHKLAKCLSKHKVGNR